MSRNIREYKAIKDSYLYDDEVIAINMGNVDYWFRSTGGVTVVFGGARINIKVTMKEFTEAMRIAE